MVTELFKCNSSNFIYRQQRYRDNLKDKQRKGEHVPEKKANRRIDRMSDDERKKYWSEKKRESRERRVETETQQTRADKKG